MCGIFGVVAARAGADADLVHVDRALDRLAHRGPDGRGTWHGPGVALGHVRLAIVDPSRFGAQPMVSDDGDTVTVFNGEIFNHRQLREVLEATGARFRGASDTEVFLHAWRRWGPAAIDKISGQFALAVYERRTQTVHLVRDRVGIKPLYYLQLDNGTVVFASEIPAILSHPRAPRRLDPVGISSFLSYRQTLGERTLFAGLRQLRPGHRASIDHRGVVLERYWRIDLTQRDHAPAPARAAHLRALVRDAVHSQLPPSPPVALLLSGGLDSAILAREVADHGVRPVMAFTARIDDAEADESVEAAETARALGVEHSIIEFSGSTFIDDAAACVAARGVPMGMHNEIGMQLLARAAAQHSKVLLCGEGADELFAGYGRIYRLPYDHLRARAVDHLPAAAARWMRRQLHLEEPTAGHDPRAFFESRYTYLPLREKRTLLTPEMQRAIADDEPLSEVIRDAFAYGEQRSLFDAVSVVFLEVHLPGLLGMVDGVTMAHGIEGRVPFLDERVVQLAFSLPAADRLAWRGPWSALRASIEPIAQFSEQRDRTKAVLRDAYARDLPAGVLTRRKKGFPVPLARWLGTTAYQRLEVELFGASSRLGAIFDLRELSTWARAGAAAASDRFGRQLWQLLNLELFLRLWFA